MKKNNLFKTLGLVIALSLTIVACKKNDVTETLQPKPDTQSVDDNADVESEFDDIFSIAEDVMDANKDQMDKSPLGTFGTLNDTTCATVTIDTTNSISPISKGRITIDFGTSNCTGTDGRSRRGKIYIAYTGKYRSVGTIITITFDEFYVNDNKIEGKKMITRVSDTDQTVIVTGGKISWTDGTTSLWESKRTRTWKEGKSTLLNIFDDVYTINGTTSGTNRKGKTFTTIIANVTLRLECWLSKVFYPVKGKVTVTPEGSTNPFIVDYGDETCDKEITVTYNGIVYEHVLR